MVSFTPLFVRLLFEDLIEVVVEMRFVFLVVVPVEVT